MINHDRLLKELLKASFPDFLSLFLPELSAGLDTSSLVFLDKELFTDIEAGATHEADLVAKARLRDHESFFLIHFEHQAPPPAIATTR